MMDDDAAGRAHTGNIISPGVEGIIKWRRTSPWSAQQETPVSQDVESYKLMTALPI